MLQTSSSEIGTVINTTEIEDLPIQGRSIASLTQLVAGFNGTYNGLPTPDQGNNIDGGISSSSRGKYSGSTTPAVSPRIESFEQVSTVTDGLSLGNGFGQASTQLNFISRRGGNQFHKSCIEWPEPEFREPFRERTSRRINRDVQKVD